MLRSENTPMKKYTIKELAGDLFASLFAGAIVAFTLHVFANSNGFAPGGVTGIASVISQFTPNIKMSYWMLIFNIPLFILCSIFVEKKLGIFLTVYILTQSLTLLLLENINFYHYVATSGNVIFASIATGVLSGVGFSIQIKRHGASGGTYAISSLIKRKNPAANVAWLTFVFDSIVVVLVLFTNHGDVVQIQIEPSLCTLLNLFIANYVVDIILQGAKDGYKFEIITDEPETIAKDMMDELKHGVTEMTVHGMYTHKERFMIVCIIRKRELSKMMKIIKRYPKSFASFSRVNEVFGNFKK